MDKQAKRNCVIIVAHPDDETLWAGGTILTHPSWNWLVLCLSRKHDENRSKRFEKAMAQFQADWVMGDLDDGPDQSPLDTKEVEEAILKLLPMTSFDLIITHDVNGEYTRHLRHEETSQAVINLWSAGKIATKDLWLFAYNDKDGGQYTQAIQTASIYILLHKRIWQEKYRIITEIYGFDSESWEARITPSAEAFWNLKSSFDAKAWLIKNKKSL